MIEQLKSAGEELRIAWNRYKHVCLSIDDYFPQGKASPIAHREIADQLEAELTFLSTHDADIKWAKAGVSKARNYSVLLSPINCLPPEILTRIFYLLLPEGHGMNLSFVHQRSGYDCPGYLTQVCSRWRRIAISCPYLWTCIDFPLWQPCAQSFARAQINAKRSSKLPLTVSIDDPYLGSCQDSYPYHTDYRQLWESIAERVEALYLCIDPMLGRFRHSICMLQDMVLSHSPRVFDKLIINATSTGHIVSAEDYNANSEKWMMRTNLKLSPSSSQIEAKFAGLTVLRLRSCFLEWTSAAYHDLVDLRLYADTGCISITESQLRTILQSSPKMRILHLAIDLATGDDVQISPVPLHELEVVKISPSRSYSRIPLGISRTLRLLEPGSNPLKLMIDATDEEENIPNKIQEFLRRCKVERFCIKGLRQFSEQLLSSFLTPCLKALVFDNCSLSDLAEILDPDFMLSTVVPNLNHWYFTYTRMLGDNLQLLATTFPKGIHVDRQCSISMSKDLQGPFYWDKLGTEFPTVKAVEDGFVDEVVAKWDILG